MERLGVDGPSQQLWGEKLGQRGGRFPSCRDTSVGTCMSFSIKKKEGVITIASKFLIRRGS